MRGFLIRLVYVIALLVWIVATGSIVIPLLYWIITGKRWVRLFDAIYRLKLMARK